jgi:Protein of unknown function (DUF2384)
MKQTITVAIARTTMRDEGVSWPRDWHVRRGNLKDVLLERPQPNFVVMPFDRRPTYTQIRQVAHKFDALSESWASSFIVFCFKSSARSFDPRTLRRWLTEFRSPDRVTFTTNWDGVMLRVTEAIAKRALKSAKQSNTPRSSAIDDIPAVIEAGKSLRTSTGRLSVRPISELFKISKSELGRLLHRTPQALWKTPDAESLQSELGYFERMARMRLILKSDADFRKWLRTANSALSGRSPLDIIREKRWQIIADLVDDVLAGTPG